MGLEFFSRELTEPFNTVFHEKGSTQLIAQVVQNGFVITPGVNVVDEDTIQVALPGLPEGVKAQLNVIFWKEDDEQQTAGEEKATSRKSSSRGSAKPRGTGASGRKRGSENE